MKKGPPPQRLWFSRLYLYESEYAPRGSALLPICEHAEHEARRSNTDIYRYYGSHGTHTLQFQIEWLLRTCPPSCALERNLIALLVPSKWGIAHSVGSNPLLLLIFPQALGCQMDGANTELLLDWLYSINAFFAKLLGSEVQRDQSNIEHWHGGLRKVCSQLIGLPFSHRAVRSNLFRFSCSSARRGEPGHSHT